MNFAAKTASKNNNSEYMELKVKANFDTIIIY
jgi:hypothetical protein